MPRRRNLWVTDTLHRVPKARLAQPANLMWDRAASAFPVRSQLPSNQFALSGKCYVICRVKPAARRLPVGFGVIPSILFCVFRLSCGWGRRPREEPT